MDCKTIINSAGIALTIIGVYMVFINSPMNDNEITDTINENTPNEKINNRNCLLRIGVYIVMFGSLLQLISNFL